MTYENLKVSNTNPNKTSKNIRNYIQKKYDKIAYLEKKYDVTLAP